MPRMVPTRLDSPPLAWALLAVLATLTYANSLSNRFVYDDVTIIEKNSRITSLDRIPQLFVQDYWAGLYDPYEYLAKANTGLYRPLVLTTYALNYAVGGVNPLGYHLVNVVLHWLVAGLVFLLARQIGCRTWAASLAAGLFAIHPIHTEAVTGIVGRAELLMSAGVLACLWSAARGRHWLAWAGFTLALLSKEQAVMLPLLLLLFHYCSTLDRRASLNQFTTSAPAGTSRTIWACYALLFTGYLALRAYATGGLHLPPPDPLGNPLSATDWVTRLLTATTIAGRYLWLMVWPVNLAADYSAHAIPLTRSPLEPGFFLGAAAWGGLVALGLSAIRRRAGYVLYAVGLILLTYLPASNLLVPIGTIMGERLFYLPSVGLCLLVAIGAELVAAWIAGHLRAATLRAGARGGLAILALLLVARSAVRNQDWATNETLARSLIRTVPQNAKAYVLLGSALMQTGLPEQRRQALDAFRTALQIFPGYDVLLASQMGELLFEFASPEEAIHMFREALAQRPDWSTMHYNLGLAYSKVGRLAEAEAELRIALGLNSSDADTYNVLSHVLIHQGRYAEGLAAAEEALKRAPDHAGARHYRKLALEGLGRS